MVAAAELVITLGREAVVDAVAGTQVVAWDTDEPSERGIEKIERMRLVRDYIATRVEALRAEFANGRHATATGEGSQATPASDNSSRWRGSVNK
jgi:hypothetical protein